MAFYDYQPVEVDLERALLPPLMVLPHMSLSEATLLMSRTQSQVCQVTTTSDPVLKKGKPLEPVKSPVNLRDLAETPILDQFAHSTVELESDLSRITPLFGTVQQDSEPVSCLLVVDEESRLLGLLTERDFVRLAVQEVDLTHLTVGEIMTTEPIVLEDKDLTDLFLAYSLLRRHSIRHLPVVNADRVPIGVISIGSLRQSLNLSYFLRFRRISEVMNYTPIVALPDQPVLEIASMLNRLQISSTIIIDESDLGMRPIGIITERDIVQLQALGLRLEKLTAQDVMSCPIFCLHPEDSLAEAHRQMEARRIRRIVITDAHGELVGILSQSNLAQVLDPIEVYGILEILHHRVRQLERAQLQLLKPHHFCITQALDRQEFVLHYQPQYSLKSSALYGVEALIRWQSPDRGLVKPAEFLPLAIDSCAIRPLGTWILEQTCQQIVDWRCRLAQPPEFVAINIAAVQLEALDFLASLEAILTKTNCQPNWLALEFTESTLVTNLEKTIDVFQGLQKLGVRVAIDDFGTGYASLGYLQNFPFDILKIDREFIAKLTKDPRKATVIHASIQMAHRLGLRVVAEGVETEAQKEFLTQAQCDAAQGFLFAKPQTVDELERIWTLMAIETA